MPFNLVWLECELVGDDDEFVIRNSRFAISYLGSHPSRIGHKTRTNWPNEWKKWPGIRVAIGRSMNVISEPKRRVAHRLEKGDEQRASCLFGWLATRSKWRSDIQAANGLREWKRAPELT